MTCADDCVVGCDDACAFDASTAPDPAAAVPGPTPSTTASCSVSPGMVVVCCLLSVVKKQKCRLFVETGLLLRSTGIIRSGNGNGEVEVERF